MQSRAETTANPSETDIASTYQGQAAQHSSVTDAAGYGPSETSTSDVEAEGTQTPGIAAWNTKAVSSTNEPIKAAPTPSTAVNNYETLASTSPSTSIPATSTTNIANNEAGALSSISDSTKTKLAIALPIAIVGLLVIFGGIFFYVRRRRQRSAPPAYDVAANQSKVISTSELMVVPKFVTPEQTTRYPALDVPNNQIQDSRPGSWTVLSPDDANTEPGLAVAVSVDQRMSATEHDMRGMTGSSPANENRRSAVRSPSQNQREEDAVSVVSDLNERRSHEEDFDDMSSVSSFNDDNPRGNHNTRSSR
ncbi:uncharacterized protein N7498_005907 [Penicillium cinerascens]|uniref:Uncharacterized protein n=1 Tax=Penicillium cinerascens TaxID=70096 RepID=A0A9W9MPF3_9EURO|nr:uncharacterized protein N7498_005907 [Penicillium cinerascens]KAJ5205028.1 hypothetical protein N7498_005907 [Penicillium cinerascens]